VTFDLDFSEIAALSRREGTSVIVLRLHDTRYLRVIDRLAAVLERSGYLLEGGVIVMVEEARVTSY
jgi:predicted nuclease of predicted toxin-antitoxin system